MFDYANMIKRAVEFFPRWTDIRKRYRSSNGGNLLSTILDESIKIEEAIQEYIDSYFLETYEGHEDEIMAFSYMANIGKIDNINSLSAQYDEYKLLITSDIKEFEKDKYNTYAYYEDGRLFIKESIYKEDIQLALIIDEETSYYNLTKYHVWNIFDEFATFVNTRRYENETNKQLADRILYITKNLPNGTELGLKNAIISELMHFDPDITMDDIKIERATPQNLIKPYEDFESLLEKLMYVNKDVYKCKRWDLDYWLYDFESISYIPHKWNESISYWQNGVGHNDDLNVIIADEDNTTDAILTLYDKSLDSFEKYVQNKDIEYDLNFKLTKYNNILNKAKIRYRIKASEIVDITNEPIDLHLYETNSISEQRSVEELYSFGKGIEIIDNSIIPVSDINWYKLKFTQKDDEDFKISKAQIIYKNEQTGQTSTQNLLRPCSGFIYNAEQEIVSSNNQKIIYKTEEFYDVNNLVNADNGITIDEYNIDGSATYSLGNYSGLYMTVDYSCEQVDLPKNVIQSRCTYWNDSNELIIRGDYSTEEKEVVIELDANSFQFEVVSTRILGRSTATLYEDDIEIDTVVLDSSRDNNKNVFSIEETARPRRIKVVINTLSNNDVVLGNFKYSNYSISFDTDKGSLELIEANKFLLPSIKNNNLNITMASVSGKKPILHKIKIGSSINEITYVTDYIKSESLHSRKFDIKTTANMSLLKIQPVSQEIIDLVAYESFITIFNLAKSYFTDDIDNFLSVANVEVQSKEEAILNIINIISTYIYDNLNVSNAMSMCLNKLIGDVSVNDLINELTQRMDSFLENYKAEKIVSIPNAIRNYSIEDMFPTLRDEMTLLNKIEWHNIARSLAENIISTLADNCTNEITEFNPKIIYKGKISELNSESFIRLDLSEYETITSITSDGGTPITIEESGKIYYNIKLNENASVSTVTITGTKNKEIRIVPLLDMVRYHIPDFDETYDKVLCSRLMDSIVISRSNPGGTPYNLLIKLNSDMLSGIRITKYELDLPSHIGSRYGTHTLSSNDNPVSYQSFDYISFYPAGGVIYEAINEYESYMEYNKDIPIINSFSPALNMTTNLIYTIENFDEKDKDNYIIRFQDSANKSDDIYSFDTWCIGRHSIIIYNKVDLNNIINYTVNSYDINSKELLSSSIDIKDSYILNNNMILDTTQYIVEETDDMIIKYEEYNGSQQKAHLLKHEEIIIDANMFNKLTYSNIDNIYHMSKKRYDNDEYTIDNINYTLLGQQGIVVWNDKLEVGSKIYLIYSIKKPIAFLIDIEKLYKAINYDIDAYHKLDTVLLSNINDKDTYDCSELDQIDNTELIHIECTNPTFEGTVIIPSDENGSLLYNERHIVFNKYITDSTILIKTGYYYINGREYYLYSEDENERIVNNKYYGSENVDISGGEITTFKPTNNFVANTEMRLKGKAGVFNYDCRQELNYGISNLNSLTACNSFNEWSYFSMRPELVQGANGLGMRFTPTAICSYAYLDITKSLIDNELNYISLLASKDLKVFIGTEDKYLDIDFNRALNIKIDKEIINTGTDLRIDSIIKELDKKYYLIVQSEGILDDIIITTDRYNALNGHNKNIDLLGLDLLETKIQGTEYRMSIEDNKDYTPYEAGLMSDGYFKTTSKLDWGITQVAKFDTEADFFDCTLEQVLVTQSFVTAGKNGGHMLTSPVYINNHSTIKKLIFKINDIELDQMTGFDIIAYTSNTYNDNYIPIGSFKNNKGYIDGQNLMQYVRFKIDIPTNKILDNFCIFAEYKSSKENPLKLPLHESGYIISKIYDLQDTLNYRLKDLGIDDISNINDVEIYVRASRDIDKIEIWHSWQRIYLKDDLSLKEYLKFFDVRFMQLKIVLKTRKSYIKFNHLDVEVI